MIGVSSSMMWRQLFSVASSWKRRDNTWSNPLNLLNPVGKPMSGNCIMISTECISLCRSVVTTNPHVTIPKHVHQLQALAQKICTSEEAQEEAEMQLRVATLVSSDTLPWMETSAGRGWQMAHSGSLSRCARDMWSVTWCAPASCALGLIR